ncbi:MAG: hypothetical protein ABI690_13635 [Chloroflexota bacterium]
MMSISLQPTDPIDQDAQKFGDMILSNSTIEERLPVYEYGRYLLAGAEPTHGTSTRFFGALYILSKRMPGYNQHIAVIKSDPGAISLLQSKIALYVLLNETCPAVLP